MSYRVKVACVIARDQGGHSHHYYEGALIGWLADDQASHFLSEDLVDEVDAESAEAKPAKTAPKHDWVAYAVSQGYDHSDADGMTKQDLIDALG